MPDDINKRLARAASEIRAKLGISLEKAAAQLDIPPEALQEFESGEQPITADFNEDFHNAFGIDLYMYAVCYCLPEDDNTPLSMRPARDAMVESWRRMMQDRLERRN